LLSLIDRGEVGEKDAARSQRHLRVLDHGPRLGHVEDDPIETALVDSLRDVADLNVVRDVVAEHGSNVFWARSAEVLRESRNPSRAPAPQESHRELPNRRQPQGRADPRSNVGLQQNRAKVPSGK
jgi:hypothetical protein